MKSPVVPISLAFLAAAALMALDSDSSLPQIPEPAIVDAAAIDPAPLREVFRDPPTMLVAGFRQRCSECHRLFESNPGVQTNLLRHEDIVLEHGLNNRCLNCHSTKNRDKLVLHGEQEIGYDQVVDLCAKCHGPTWRDWQKGMHGRTTGSWDPESPEQSRLLCTQCHDPHAPAFASIEPLPGPRTLRMVLKEPEAHEVDESKTSPLLRWMRSGHGSEGTHESTEDRR